MRFANYRFNAKGVNNLGDNMQILAIDEIYKSMGIDLNEVVYIPTDQLDSYDGEYVVLPVTMPLVDYRERGIAGRFSPRIIPVFLGLTMVKDTLEHEEVAYYKRFEPIGCRDERTLQTMRSYQIQSYLHGCITVTLPRREFEPENGKVYIVDVDQTMLERIPTTLREQAVFRTHLITEKLADPKAVMQERYQDYCRNANLVITSLLHCSVPCVAAGIPVILLKKAVSYRMAWLEKLLPIYTPDRLNEIDWSPKPVEMEAHKKQVLELTVRRLQETYEKNAPMYDLSYFYEDRERSVYINDACDSLKRFVDENWTDRNAFFSYSVWGLTQISEWLVDYISSRYPNAQLCHAYDAYRRVQFKGLTSESPDMIIDRREETVFVTTNGAEKAARELFQKIGKPAGTYAYMKVVH